MKQGLDGLSLETLEIILAKLPVASLLQAAGVCRDWCKIVRSRSFKKYYDSLPDRKSWFFQCCVNNIVEGKNQGFGYDPETNEWHQLSSHCFPADHERTALASSPDGLTYSLFSLTYTTYKPEFLSKVWMEAPMMNSSRAAPLMGLVQSGDGSHKIVVAGGVSFFEDNELAVEIYDSESRSWEQCDILPEEFRDICSRHWMTSAVAQGKFFVAETYTGLTATMDWSSKRWSDVRALRPAGTVHSHLMASRGDLLLAGTCLSGGKLTFKIWRVNTLTQECGTQFATMPDYLFENFVRSDGVSGKAEGLHCVASGDVIYVHSREQHHEGHVVACDLSGLVPCWRLLPPLPATSYFTRGFGFTSPVTLSSLLQEHETVGSIFRG